MVGPPPDEPLTQRIGPYEVLLDIGSGGMGTISLACATGEPVGASGFARLVAIKRPHGALAADAEVLGRFLDEARLLAQVHHANVVGIHQIGADPGGHFLVLDYIEGGSLDELVTRSILHRKKLPPPVVLRIASDMLAGLHAVHEAADVEGKPLRMLHRDVSTQNVLVGRDGVARLADFGIAKAIISSVVTDRAYLQGRVAYMPPEYLRREQVDRRLDVYAAGVTLWAALAGKLPWQDAAEAQVIHHAVFQGIPPLSSAGVTVAPALEEIVARACDRAPANRFATAEDMLRALDELGRRTGWLASHAEVASLVEVLLGAELRARRATIAQRLSAPGRSLSPALPMSTPVPLSMESPTPAPRRSPPPPPPEALAPTTRIARSIPTAAPGGAPRGRSRVALLIGAITAVSAGVVAWTLRDPARSAPPADEPPAPASAPPNAPSSAPAASITAVSTSSGPTPQPLSSAAPTARPTAPPRPSAVPTALPTGISTANPYRK
jgi:serine/threonine protein kinase